jgi:SAM-dependent methyltransferase
MKNQTLGLNRLKKTIPWWAKIPAKLVLARLPVRYGLWKRLGIFRHGRMDTLDYAMRVFRSHFEAGKLDRGFTCLELGPGDSLVSALVAFAHGARRIYLVDAGTFASQDVSFYHDMVAKLETHGYRVPATFDSVEEMLKQCGAQYFTNGLNGLRSIPFGSVDFIWSQSVLEHVWKREFQETVSEWSRVLKPEGFGSHHVDLKDHLNYALNNLRFPESVWESSLFRTSGFYTNRIRFSEMLHIFEKCGFAARVSAKTCWQQMPTPRSRLHNHFRELPDDDLLVSSFAVVLRHRATPVSEELAFRDSPTSVDQQ